MVQVTKVLYDTSQAIKELNKLNKKVDESGDMAEDAFDKSDKAAERYDKALNSVSGTIGKTVSGVRTISVAVGGMAGIVGGVAVGALTSLVAQFIDFDEILKDSIASIEQFNQATGTIFQSREAISNIGDQGVNRDIAFAQRSLKFQEIEVARAENSVNIAKLAAQDRLRILQQELQTRESRLQDSVNREKQLRDRLNQRNVQDAGAGFQGLPVGRRALELGAAARQAALQGNVDLAEELEKLSQEAGEEAGNHVLFLNDQESTRNAINRALERAIQAEEKAGQAAEASVNINKERIERLEEEIRLLERCEAILSRTSKEISAERTSLEVRSEETRDQQQADTAARAFEKGVRDFQFNIRDGGSSFKESVISAGGELLKIVTDERGRQAALRQFAGAGAAAGRISAALTDGDGLTSQDVENLSGDFGLLTDAIARLEANQQKLTGGAQRQLERLQLLRDSVSDIFDAAANFRRVRLDTQEIQEGSQAPSRTDLDNLRTSILDLTNVLKEGTRAGNVNAPTTSTATGVPQPVGATGQQITVNANVKGGIVDAEVTREIVRIVREEIRKGTGNIPT